MKVFNFYAFFFRYTNISCCKKSLTADNQWFLFAAKEYARHNSVMSKGAYCSGVKRFPEGITNGAHWYFVSGLYS